MGHATIAETTGLLLTVGGDCRLMLMRFDLFTVAELVDAFVVTNAVMDMRMCRFP